MVLDVIMPVPIENEGLVGACISSLAKFTDVPFRVVVVCDGGTRGDWSVEFLLESLNIEYAIAHNPQPIYLNRCIEIAIPMVHHKLAALIPPEYVIHDEKWFGKMQQIFLKDPHAVIVDASAHTKSTALTPTRRDIHHLSSGNTRFAMVSAGHLSSMGAPPKDEEPVPWWGSKAISIGGNVWAAPGVNIQKVESKDHPTWLEPSAQPTSQFE